MEIKRSKEEEAVTQGVMEGHGKTQEWGEWIQVWAAF